MSSAVHPPRSETGPTMKKILLLLACLGTLSGTALAAARPDILLIVADDLGYGDMSAYGCKEFATPHLDRLAAQGLRFSSGYVAAPVCGPSRAGLLTGRHPSRIPFHGNPAPGSESGLPLEHKTMADHLKAAGYRTAALGKWHLGETPQHHPMSRGFDEFFGFLSGMHSYFKAEDAAWGPVLRGREKAELKQYLTFALADEACAFIRRQKADPFFLYLAFNAPHVPLEAPDNYLAKTQHLADPRRKICAAMILALDDAIGRVLAALRESGRAENTLVVFLSDNGAALIPGSAENGGSNAPLRGSKAQLWEGGVRVPFCIQWPGHIKAGGVSDTPVSSLDLLPTFLAAAQSGHLAPRDVIFDGVNLLPWLEGKAEPPVREHLFWKFGARQMAIRGAEVKLVQVDADKGLFNLRQDIAETKDITAKRPVLARQLEAAWKKWDAANLVTTRTPRAKPAAPPVTFVHSNLPNIVLVLADDLGYGDVSCYNPQAKFKTPNVDRLAAQGTRFTDVHTPTSVCTPTRYGILTGRHSWRTRLQRGVLNDYDPPLIAPDRLTLPALLAQHGYRTACVGKWHLGFDWNIAERDLPLFKFGYRKGAPGAATEAHRAAWQAAFSQLLRGGPVDHGFQSYFGPDVPNMPPYGFIRDDKLITVPTVLKQAGDVSDTGNKTTTGPAGPMVAGYQFDQIMPSLVREAEAVIARHAAAKQPFFLYFPLTAPHFPVVPSADFMGKSGVCPLADFILETDAALGSVMAALEKNGVADNTLLIFTSDNGPAHNSRAPLEQAGHNGSGPLRGSKASIYEGGHRVPFVARWPGHTPVGAVSAELICQTTFMATCAELLGAKLPDAAAEDSYSILPLLRGAQPAQPTHPAVIHNPGARLFAIRQGPLKQIVMPDGKDELYDLASDLGETKNVIAEHREKAAELTALLKRWLESGRSTPGAPQQNDVPVALRDPTAPVNDRAQSLRSAP